jgi:hypothetical protein
MLQRVYLTVDEATRALRPRPAVLWSLARAIRDLVTEEQFAKLTGSHDNHQTKGFSVMYYSNSGFYPTNAIYLFNGEERGKQILQWRLPGTADCETRPVKSGEVAAFCRKHGLKLIRNGYEQGWLVVAETERQQFEFKLWFDAAPPLRTEWDAHAAAYEIARQEKLVQTSRQHVAYCEGQVERARRSLAQEEAKLEEVRRAA